MKEQEKIIRSYNDADVITDDSRKVYGCAVKFETESQNLGFIETIKRGAITQETIENSDIYALFNHNEDEVLARSRYGNGSLKLELREDGLYYEFDAPNTEKGNEVLEHLKRNELEGSSFAFSLPKDGSGDKWYKDDEGNLRRDIYHIEKLYDVSCVYEPAYLDTSCDRRALNMIDKSSTISKKMDLMIEEVEQLKIK